MAGLVPAIHEARLQKDLRRSGLGGGWRGWAGTSPAMRERVVYRANQPYNS